MAQTRRWRLKAEEIRNVADSMAADSSRRAYLRLADGYETLAESYEREAQQLSRQERDAG